MRHMLEYAPVGYTASDPNNLPQVGHPHNMTTRNAAPYTAYPTAGTKAENYHTAQREREGERRRICMADINSYVETIHDNSTTSRRNDALYRAETTKSSVGQISTETNVVRPNTGSRATHGNCRK